LTWWTPSAHADRRPRLLARARLAKAVRAYFDKDGFVESECAQLVTAPGAETHLQAFAIEPARGRRFLHTSPEFACKKLLAAGERRIFELARVFRAGERGPWHAEEFTLLEWYRAGAPLAAVIEDCLALLQCAATAANTQTLTRSVFECDPWAPPEHLSVAEAFARHAGIDLLATLGADGMPNRAALAAAVRTAGLRVGADDDWSDLFSRALVERVEPHLGFARATVLRDYPAPEAALARRTPDDPRVAERFELYVCGIELANGFAELTDPIEQRARLEAAMAQKKRRYGEDWPIDEDFLEALAAMPDAAGCALGFDRLAMLAVGAQRIEDVLWTPPAPGCSTPA
jgi:lysyl-tRNA synthetase class 2